MKESVIKILKSWEMPLERYGKLDEWKLDKKLSVLGSYLIEHDDDQKVLNVVRNVRDAIICTPFNTGLILTNIKHVLKLVEDNPQPCLFVKNIKYGQRKRFKHETLRIFEEKLRFKNDMPIRNFDIEVESARDSRLVRRIIEKRMCQAYHKMNKHEEKESNNSRYWKHRATAFQLYNIGQVEHLQNVSRGKSTHWKRDFDPFTGEIVFKKKMAYSTKIEALDAIKIWENVNHPEDKGKMHAYECKICHKWHIGHGAL